MWIWCYLMENIIRFGVSIEPSLLKKFDRIIKKKGYTNRSEALRDLIRKNIVEEESNRDKNMEAVGTLTMVYNHHTGSLANRLLDIQHMHHDLILSTTHVHIDHHNCLEVLMLRGRIGDIQKISDNIKALRGIKHGELVITKTGL